MSIVRIDASSRLAVSHRGRSPESGVVLIVALMAMLFMMALGTALILTTSTESRITRNFRISSEALYAADAVLERAVDDILAIENWDTMLSGAAQSAFIDGPPSGARALADGHRIDVGEIVNLANCRRTAACSNADMDAVSADRPWGSNNPRWQPFAWGDLDDITPTGTVSSPFYVVMMVGDDPSENDGNPLLDGSAPCAQGQEAGCNPGSGVLALRAEAFGPFGAHKILEVTISRADIGERGQNDTSNGRAAVRILSWREVR